MERKLYYDLRNTPPPYHQRTNIGEDFIYTVDSVLPWMEDAIQNTLFAAQTPLPQELQQYCPLNDRSLLNLAAECYSNSDDRPVMRADFHRFEQSIQQIVNHMALAVPQFCFEGVHGTGKTPLVQILAKRLRSEGYTVGVTKYNGFVSDKKRKESKLYTGLASRDNLRSQLLYWDEEKDKIKYSSNYDPSPGQQSWLYLKEHWLMLASRLYNKTGALILGERGPNSRSQSWDKDIGQKGLSPFETRVNTNVVVENFGNDELNYMANIRWVDVTLPLPYTLYLDEDIKRVQARLAEQGESAREAKNYGNYLRMTAYIQAYQSALSRYTGGDELFMATKAESMEDKVQAGYEYVMRILAGK